MNRLTELFDRVREPGWPRRIAILVVIVLIFCIPYPLSITGDFEIISLHPMQTRTLIDGTVAEIDVKMGDHVKKDQVVARLLDVELKLEHDKVAAELAEVQAQLALAQKGFRTEEVEIARARVEGRAADAVTKEANFRRETALYRAKDSPKAKLDEARNEYIQAQKSLEEAQSELSKLKAGNRMEEIAQAAARVEQLKGRLATSEQHIAWTAIKAPIDGYVVTPDHELQKLHGVQLARGAAVLEIVNPEDLVARIAVPEKEFGDVELKQDVDLRAFQFPSTTFSGEVDQIELQVDRNDATSSMIPVIAKVTDKRWTMLREHARGRAKISLGYHSLGYVLYRRLLRSVFVNVWSWY